MQHRAWPRCCPFSLPPRPAPPHLAWSPHLQGLRGQSRVCAPPEGGAGRPQWQTFCGPFSYDWYIHFSLKPFLNNIFLLIILIPPD